MAVVQVLEDRHARLGEALADAAAAALEAAFADAAGGHTVVTAAGIRVWLRTLLGRPHAAQALDDVPTTWRQRARGVMQRLRAAVMASATDIAEQLPAAADTRDGRVPPLPAADAVQRYLADAQQRIDGIGDEAWARCRDALAGGLAAGEDAEALAARVQDALDVSLRRARTIARTEAAMATNAGTLAAIRVSGLRDVAKTWRSVLDEHTRPAHRAADEQTVLLDEPFSVGGEQLTYPGDPAGTPGNVINCRCRLAYHVGTQPVPVDWAPRAPGAPTVDDWMDAVARGADAIPDHPGLSDYDEWLVSAAMGPETTEAAESRIPDQLRNYWLHGEGAVLIGWGTPGSFERCVTLLGEHYPANPEGLCANLHHDATGQWPGHHGDGKHTARTAVTAAGAEHTGAMVALVPTAADRRRLAVEGGEAPEQLHCTLLYLGDADGIPGDARTALVAALEQAPDTLGIISAEGFAIDLFNPPAPAAAPDHEDDEDDDREPCIVLGLGGEDLAAAHAHVAGWAAEALAAAGAELPEQHVPWVPHVTLRYAPGATPQQLGELAADLVDRCGEVAFSVLRVAFAGEVTDIPLGESSVEDDVPYQPTDDAEPGATTAAAAAAGGEQPPPAPEVVDVPEGAWEGVLTVEGSPTGDGRQFAAGSLTTAPLPMPLRWQDADTGGHDGAVVVGRIDTVWRDGPRIWGRGVCDLGSPAGVEAYRRLEAGFAGGVSVDVDSITDADVTLVYGPEDGDGWAPVELEIYDRARLRAATLVAIPAFVEASVRPGWSQTPTDDRMEAQPMTIPDQTTAPAPDGPPALAACACTDTAPPAEWFVDPQLTGPTPLTITPEGRVYGHGAVWGTCHTGYAGQCVTPPREPDGQHVYYRLGETLCADGTTVATGTLTLGTGHAPAAAGAQAAVEHYDHTGTAVADVATGEDQYGIWVAGAVRPGTPPERIAELRAAKLSGDWRRIGGTLRLVGLLAVNVPGFPVPRIRTHSTDGRQTALVAAGVLHVDQAARDAQSLRTVAASLARRIGRDPATRLAALTERVHGTGRA